VSYARLLCFQLAEPAAGLERFESYLRASANGPLREEALSGKAECLARLGRASEAANAWRALLREAPNSLYAAEARKYLAGTAGETP
jgi:hypothetical protein